MIWPWSSRMSRHPPCRALPLQPDATLVKDFDSQLEAVNQVEPCGFQAGARHKASIMVAATMP